MSDLENLLELLELRLKLIDKKLDTCVEPYQANDLFVEVACLESIINWAKKAIRRKKMSKNPKTNKDTGFFQVPLKLSNKDDVTVFYDLSGAKEFAARINSVVLNKDGSLNYMPETKEVLKYDKDHLDLEGNL
jgi:hypothetical protein|tara:strand:+ start:1704 stop:2102 length:399 start_codon:yes stop_codon:yes gene_type:complete